jgi:hypothetical protein
VQQSLQRFVERYGRLPCPAVPTLAAGAAGQGVEDTVVAAPPGAWNTSCPNVAVGASGMARGVVPWVTLGLPLEQVQDGYARMLTYNVTISATQLGPSSVGSMRGNMTIHSVTPTTLGLPPTGNQINSCWTAVAAPPAGENSCNMNAVVVLVSHGENGAGAYTASGGQLPAPTVPAEIENTDVNTAFVRGDVSATGFDDVLFTISPDELFDSLERRGALKSAMANTQDVLRITATQVSNAIANAATCTGGPPCSATANYPTFNPVPATVPPAPDAAKPTGQQVTIGSTTINMPTDGWGTNPVLYSSPSTGTNICGQLAGTELFTLTSAGVDGVFITPAGTANPGTNRYDDTALKVTIDQVRDQINTRFGAGACP